MTGAARYTNLAWPGDPYRTGQQLFRKPGPMLAAFTLASGTLASDPADDAGREALVSAAMVYLPLHRTRAILVTGQAIAFGFQVTTAGGTALPGLAQAADLDLARARRHAAILAGHLLADDLTRLQALAGEAVLRGVAATERDWATRQTPVKGKAMMIDCGADLPARSLGQACRQAQIIPGAGWDKTAPGRAADSELAAALAVGRALMLALLSARHLGRASWQQDLDITEIITASAWDCFPRLRANEASNAARQALALAAGPVTGGAK